MYHSLQMFKEKLSRIALILVCRLFSANKNVCYHLSPVISEESCNRLMEERWAHRASPGCS